ncbi:Vi polysaccharide biosynthesis protein VipB/TviC [Microgenomates group bacterium RBG_16_45_19]|nr:MAG: Vi polysaccharide biosynthesis protein VipB/TviC [Microgenomates group bacterium RBG_16_45_19]
MGGILVKEVYLVTGGAGFIGSHIVDELVEKGIGVRVLDNLTTGTLENLRNQIDKIEFIEGDIRDVATVKRAMNGVDVVLHQAAMVSVPLSIDKPKETTECNLNGTLHLLMAAREAGVRRFVYASSCAVYGNDPILPKVEDQPPAPLSAYAASKLAAEYYCQVYHRVYGLETVCLRYFNVFGPRQDPLSPYAAVIPKFITLALAKKPLVVYGDGEQGRDFSFVENVVQANLLACNTVGAVGETFNIGCGEEMSINQLVEKLKEIIKTDINVRYSDPNTGDIKHSVASIEKAQRLLGYTPTTTLIDGLHRTIEWYKAIK